MSEKQRQDKLISRLFLRHSDNDDIDLNELLDVLKERKRFILLVMAIVFLLACLYAANIAPLYETSALIQIDSKSGSGMRSMLSNLETSVGYYDYYRATPSQIEQALMSSRFILQPTIENLGLNIYTSPRYFPIFGAYFFHHHKGKDLAKPFLGLKKYAWGGEQIVIDRLNISSRSDVEDAEIKAFRVLVKTPGFYDLYSAQGEHLLSGVVGKISVASSKSKIPKLKILISKLRANPGAEFFVMLQPIEPLVNQLASSLKIKDLGVDKKENWMPTETGVLSVTLTGSDFEKLPKILNTIIYFDIQKNFDKKNIEAKKTLSFLSRQSLSLKKELEHAETTLSDYKMKKGVLGVSAASQTLLNQLVDLEKEIQKIKLKKIFLRQEFTEQHPYIMSLTQQQNKLQQEVMSLELKIATLPKSEQKLLSLEREVKVKDELYVLLLNKIQQMQIIKEGTMSDVRILGLATKPVQIPSKVHLILLGSLLFGFIFATIIIYTRYFLTKRMDDPDYIEEHLQIPFYALIPFSKKQKSLFQEMKRRSPGTGPFVLAIKQSDDLAIESLRSLRTTMLLEMQEARNNIIAILGASPEIGKSFVSLNLAYVMADIGKKVLLIDADLRNGKINDYLEQNSSPGLAEILSTAASFEKIRRVLRKNQLDFVAVGRYPNNPADLLFGNSLKNLLENVAQQYDLVIIDTPPVLTIADALTIAKHAGINLLLIGSGVDQFKTLEHVVKTLQKNEIQLNGLIFNNAKSTKKGYKYGKYKYYYRDYSQKKGRV